MRQPEQPVHQEARSSLQQHHRNMQQNQYYSTPAHQPQRNVPPPQQQPRPQRHDQEEGAARPPQQLTSQQMAVREQQKLAQRAAAKQAAAQREAAANPQVATLPPCQDIEKMRTAAAGMPGVEVEAPIAKVKKSGAAKRGCHMEDYVPIHVIGKGSYGKVLLVRAKFGKQKTYAMKILRKDNIMKRNQVVHTQTERKVLDRVNHPFIVTLHYAFQNTRKLYFVLEYCCGGELFFHLQQAGRFSEGRCRFYSSEIVLALEHLHSMHIIYRDLKPENVLLCEHGHVKITDFGLSKEGVKDNYSAKSMCGTPEYLAPEILNGQGHGKAVDWYSLGALCYEMLTGLPPYYSRDRDELFRAIQKARLAVPSFLKPVSRDFLKRLLHPNPEHRLGSGSEDSKEVRGHEFYREIDWDKLLQKKYRPPFVPEIEGKEDVRNFDRDFIGLNMAQSDIISPNDVCDLIHFRNFSYVASHEERAQAAAEYERDSDPDEEIKPLEIKRKVVDARATAAQGHRHFRDPMAGRPNRSPNQLQGHHGGAPGGEAGTGAAAAHQLRPQSSASQPGGGGGPVYNGANGGIGHPGRPPGSAPSHHPQGYASSGAPLSGGHCFGTTALSTGESAANSMEPYSDSRAPASHHSAGSVQSRAEGGRHHQQDRGQQNGYHQQDRGHQQMQQAQGKMHSGAGRSSNSGSTSARAAGIHHRGAGAQYEYPGRAQERQLPAPPQKPQARLCREELERLNENHSRQQAAQDSLRSHHLESSLGGGTPHHHGTRRHGENPKNDAFIGQGGGGGAGHDSSLRHHGYYNQHSHSHSANRPAPESGGHHPQTPASYHDTPSPRHDYLTNLQRGVLRNQQHPTNGNETSGPISSPGSNHGASRRSGQTAPQIPPVPRPGGWQQEEMKTTSSPSGRSLSTNVPTSPQTS